MDPVEYLFSLEFHGIKLGLDNINALLDAMDNPQHACPTVHIAGSNGKGSTVAFLDYILRQAGYTVGRFTSPHLVSVHERFTVNGTPIPDDTLRVIIENIRTTLDALDIAPTFFEVNTAIAFEHFKREQVDIALIEVGMGGRFDSTNVISPLLTIITNISLEHTQYLGDAIPKIAFEKAGILKEKIPCILGRLVPEACEVIRQRAIDLKCPVHEFENDFPATQHVQLGLIGDHQKENASLAARAASLLQERFPRITDETIRTGLANTRWPCRMETVLHDPEVIIDVAHNAHAAEVLARSLHGQYGFVLSVAQDKNAAAMMNALAPLAEHLIISEFEGPRALDANSLANAVPHNATHEIVTPLNDAIDAGIHWARTNGLPLVITGSLFTAGQARAYLIDKHNAPPLCF